MPMHILITDSDNRSALAATRSLGRKGHRVLVSGTDPRSIAAVSRYAAAFVPYPNPMKYPAAFVDAILAAVHEHQVDMLLPMTDVTTLLLTGARERLPAHCALPFADRATLESANDKASLLTLARDLGVPVPETRLVELSARGTPPMDLSFPVVVKPVRSRIADGSRWISTGVSYAATAAELQAKLATLHDGAFPVLLQERITGPGVGFFACYDRGKLLAQFAHRRLREKPPSGGVSVLRESTDVDPQALAHGTRLLGALNWHGVAMVEFKRDSRDGSLKLMEINPRFWGSLQLAIDAGVDFPAIVAAMVAGERLPPAGYRAGVRSRWIFGDLDVLMIALFQSRSKLRLPADFPSRARLIWDFLQFWRKDQYEESFRYGDLRPGFLQMTRWLRGH